MAGYYFNFIKQAYTKMLVPPEKSNKGISPATASIWDHLRQPNGWVVYDFNYSFLP